MNVIQRGGVDQTVSIVLKDSNGDPVTTLTNASAGLFIEVMRPKEALVAITPASLASITAAHADGGFIHHGRGAYRIDLTDAVCANTNLPEGLIMAVGATGVKTSHFWIPMSDDADVASASASAAALFQQMYGGDLAGITSPAAVSMMNWMRMGGLPLSKVIIDDTAKRIKCYAADELTLIFEMQYTGSITTLSSMDRV